MRKVFNAWYVTVFWGRETGHTYVFLEKAVAVEFVRCCRRLDHDTDTQMFESIMDNGKVRPVEEYDPEWELVVNKSPMCEYSSELMEDDDE